LEKITNNIPLGVKDNIVNTFKDQVKLFKNLGTGLQEKINWDKKKTKAVVCLGIYALMNVMGSVLHADESDTDSDTDLDGELNLSFLKSTLSGAINELNTLDATPEQGDLFFNASMELAKEMTEIEELDGERVKYNWAINKMLEWSEYAQESGISLEEYKNGLSEISDNFLDYINGSDEIDSNDNLDDSVENNNSILNEIVLPEKAALEFDSHFSEINKMNMQKGYNSTVEEIHAAAEKFEWWGDKYGDRDAFSKFEEQVKDYINGLIAKVEKIESNAKNPDHTLKTYSNHESSNIGLKVEFELDKFSKDTGLRSDMEEMDDQFENF